MSKMKIKVRESTETEVSRLFKQLAETVLAIMKSGKVNIYYDSEPNYPAEIYVGRAGYEIAIYPNGSIDPSIDTWLAEFESKDINDLAEYTYITLGTPYRRADDDMAGKEIPTYEEWNNTLKMFSPNYYDPTIDIYCLVFHSVADIKRFIKKHASL